MKKLAVAIGVVAVGSILVACSAEPGERTETSKSTVSASRVKVQQASQCSGQNTIQLCDPTTCQLQTVYTTCTMMAEGCGNYEATGCYWEWAYYPDHLVCREQGPSFSPCE
jgi:hypothetical protein